MSKFCRTLRAEQLIIMREQRELDRTLNGEQKRHEYEIMKEQERLRLRRPMEKPMVAGGMAM